MYTAILSDYWYLSKYCRLTIFSWASVPILDFINQQGKFATYATYVTKLTLGAEAAFIRKIFLCFHVFASPKAPLPTKRVHLWCICLA